jgi:hypothetical protein
VKQTLLAALHLIGAAIFVVFMIARTAQAIGGANPEVTPADRLTPPIVTNAPVWEGPAAPSTGAILFQ